MSVPKLTRVGHRVSTEMKQTNLWDLTGQQLCGNVRTLESFAGFDVIWRFVNDQVDQV